ncbi:MAG: AAA family ATPase [Candidatus Paceibacterota bacterium]
MYNIAVAGKGGVGKTTIAALIVEILKRQGNTPILAVDADPNSTLGDWLGIPYKTTVADIIEETKGLKNLPEGVSKPTHLEYQLQQAITESKGIDLLVMGRPEGPDCYCMANNILRGYMDKISRSYKYVVLDNEAGMEHLNRKTTQNIDTLLLVSDPSQIGLKTAMRINQLIDKLTFLSIKKRFLVINRVKNEKYSRLETSLKIAGLIPDESILTNMDMDGKPVGSLADNHALITAARELVSKIL